MSLRPQQAFWFNLVLAKEDLLAGLRTLARTQAVELQAAEGISDSSFTSELGTLLARFDAFLAEHEDELPQPQPQDQQQGDLLEQTRRAFDTLLHWHREAAPVLTSIRDLTNACNQLTALLALAKAAAASGFELGHLAGAGPVLQAAFIQFENRTVPSPFSATALYTPLGGINGDSGVLLFDRTCHSTMAQYLAANKGHLVTIPSDWQGSNEAIIAAIDQQLSAARGALLEAQRHLQVTNATYACAEQLGWLLEMAWLADQLPAFRMHAVTTLATGWCALSGTDALNRQLERAQVRALASASAPPKTLHAPMVLHNPRWARPFEIFIRVLGIPGPNEADPSILLAVIAPILFGYMFGDAGQGAVLILVGLYLRRRFPLAQLLVPGGIMAILFGVLFGSVFSLHGILPPVWLDPLSAPLTVLTVPLAGGFTLLSLGLLLNALEAVWQRQTVLWLQTQAGLMLAYIGTGWAVSDPAGYDLLIFGLIWHFIGFWRSRPGRHSLLEALASLLESGMQLAVNTLSFVRVGAFALAHAGLSMAIVSLAHPASNRLSAVLIIVAGNAVMIVLETMVVSIQTTRLILLEFFLRFAGVHGRIMKPLRLPVFTLSGRIINERE